VQFARVPASLTMRAILKSTALLGGASLVSAAFGMLTAKAGALLLGTSGIGYFGLLQSLLGVLQLLGAFGLSASVVRFGAAAAAEGEASFAAVRRAGWLVVLTASAVLVPALLIFRAPIGRTVLGSADRATAVVTVAAVLLLGLASVLQMGILAARKQIRGLATVTIVGSALGAAAQIAIFWRFGMPGVPAAVASAAALQFLFSCVAVRTLVPPTQVRVPRLEVTKTFRQLVAFGGPHTASNFAGSGVHLLLPVLILSLLDLSSVGIFRASFTFSASYLGLVLVALSQDYFPRLAAERDSALATNTVNQQFRLLLLVGGPLIHAAMAFAPTLIRLLYSSEFLPAVSVLRWQMIGDVFRFQAVVLSYVVLVYGRPVTFFAMEAVSGVVLIGSVSAAVGIFGLPGSGIGYAVSFGIYALVVWFTARRMLPFRWESRNLVLLSAVLAVCLVIRFSPDVQLGPVVFSLGVIAALGYAAYALLCLYREGSGRTLQSPTEVVDPS
jgi:O-antigen/teichoic acid export membrane protein